MPAALLGTHVSVKPAPTRPRETETPEDHCCDISTPVLLPQALPQQEKGENGFVSGLPKPLILMVSAPGLEPGTL
jgi:hypothetical protein